MRAPITSLNYKLPSTIEAIQQNWVACMKSSTIISGLLAVVSAVLLILFKALPMIGSTNIPKNDSIALEVLSYASLFLNISCGVSSVLLLDRLGEVPYRSAREPQPRLAGRTTLTAHELLKEYKVGGAWSLVLWHWLFCLITGVGSLLAELLVYVWTVESKEIKIVISCLCLFCIAPVFVFLFSTLLERQSKEEITSDADTESQRSATPISPLAERNGTGMVSRRPALHNKGSLGSVSFKTPRSSFIDTNLNAGPSVTFETQPTFRVDSPSRSPRLPTSPTSPTTIPR